MATATAERKTISAVPAFGIEVDPPRNSDVVIQSIPGCKLRGSIRGTKPIKDVKTGELMVPVDQARRLAAFPPIPGMQVHVNPAKLTYTIVDPLRGDEKLCEQIRRRLSENSAFRVSGKIDGVPPQSGTLDKHRMKTLCRELVQMLDAGHAKLVKGPRPDIDDVNDLPGEYLLNPGSRVPNMQPRFEKDWDGWVERLTRTGG